jgi:hypothetical protein
MMQNIFAKNSAILSDISIFDEIFGTLGAGGNTGSCTLMFGINDGSSGSCGGLGRIGIVGRLRS